MISDFHTDILTETTGDLPQFYYDNNIITAVFRGERAFAEAVKIAERGRLIAFEDVGYDDFDIEKLTAFNPIYVGITWNGENRFGFGCKYSEGLKPEGKRLITLLNERNIAVDTAHISKGGFKDIIDNAKIVVNSHTCFSGVYEHKRNIDDYQIKEIVERGGVIGVTFVGYFMTGDKKCKISDLIRQIDYFCQKFGTDNLAIGSDFYGTDFLPEGFKNYEGYDKVKEYLSVNLGYKNDDIDKILYKNLADFTKRIKRLNNAVDNIV